MTDHEEQRHVQHHAQEAGPVPQSLRHPVSHRRHEALPGRQVEPGVRERGHRREEHTAAHREEDAPQERGQQVERHELAEPPVSGDGVVRRRAARRFGAGLAGRGVGARDPRARSRRRAAVSALVGVALPSRPAVERRERALVRDAQRGSAVALEQLFRLHWSRAYRAALREDPDVLVLEQIRTGLLMNVALEAAASGHIPNCRNMCAGMWRA